MRKYLLLLLVSLHVFAQEEITIKSYASIEYPVNKIAIVFDINTTKTDKSIAEEENYNKTIKVLNMLESLGYGKDDIITLNSNISGGRNRDKEDEYTSRSSYSFLLSDLEKFDDLRKRLLDCGVESISYKKICEDEDKYKKEAYQKALDEAKRSAELIASDFEKKNFRLKKIIDGGVSYRDRQQQMEDELLGKSPEDRLYYKVGGDDATVKVRESTLTKLTATARVDLLLVFEVTR